MRLLLALFVFVFLGILYGQESIDLDQIKDDLSNQQESTLGITEALEIEDSLEKNLSEDTDKIFGHSFFDYESTTSTPLLDIPLQSQYIISFNDELEVLFTGNIRKSYPLRVDLSGNVLIPEIGSVSLVNLSLFDANIKVQEMVSKTLVGTQSQISVSKPSVRKISIIGAVKNPGTYIVNPFTSVSEALKYAGGVKEIASIRQIEVINNNGEEEKVDLYDFLIFGKRDTDISLKNGDTVFVPATSNFFTLSGAIFRPLKYEHVEGKDTILDIIDFGLGAKKDADLSKVTQNFLRDDTLISEPINLNEILANKLDSVFIPSRFFKSDLKAQVYGSEVNNGFFPYSENQTLKSFISQLKFSNNIYPFAFVLMQEDLTKGRKIKEIKILSLSDAETYENLALKSNVQLHFLSLEDIINFSESYLSESDISLNQNTNDEEVMESPDKENEFENFDILEKLKGNLAYLKVANDTFLVPLVGSIDISRLINSFSSAPFNQNEVSVVLDEKVILDGYTSTVQNGEEVISIVAPEIRSSLIQVSIDGAVPYPGEYFVSLNTTLDDLYKISGGFLEKSDPRGILLLRENLKKKEYESFLARRNLIIDLLISNISKSNTSEVSGIELISFLDRYNQDDFTGRLTGDLSAGSDLAKSVVLKNNDQIYVPMLTSEIIVSGEVAVASSLAYKKGKKLDHYLKASGGLTAFADRSRIFVIQVNGQTITNRDYLIEPGDTIVVPKDLTKIEPLNLVSIVTSLVSDLALAAASLNVLNR